MTVLRRSHWSHILFAAFLLGPVSRSPGYIHAPSIDKEHAFGVTHNSFGTTSVGVRVGPLLIYFEHSDTKPQPPAGWVRVDYAPAINASAKTIEFRCDAKILRPVADPPIFGITIAELRELASAKSVSVTIIGEGYGETKTTGHDEATFSADDMKNLQALLDYGHDWKPPAEPASSLPETLHAMNIGSLSPAQLDLVKKKLIATIDHQEVGAFSEFAVYSFADRGYMATHLGTILLNPEGLATAKTYLVKLAPKPTALADLQELEKCIPDKFPTVNVYTTPELKIEASEKFLKFLHENTIRINFIVFDANKAAGETEKNALVQMKKLASETDGRFIEWDEGK